MIREREPNRRSFAGKRELLCNPAICRFGQRIFLSFNVFFILVSMISLEMVLISADAYGGSAKLSTELTFLNSGPQNKSPLGSKIALNADKTVADCDGWNDLGKIYDPGKAYYPSVRYDGASQFSGHGAAYSYKVWYSGSAGITHAGSDDGVNWTVIAAPVSGLTNAHHCQVVYDANGFGGSGYYYRIWYWDTALLYTINAIRTAESSDGENWVNDQAITQQSTEVVNDTGYYWNRGSYGPITILYNETGADPVDHTNIMNNKYVMYYDGTTGGIEQIGLAYSLDGFFWYGYNGGAAPVLPRGSSGEWDENYACFGTILKNPSGLYEMWYSGGVTAAHQGIGYASSADGMVWTKCTNNPIQSLGGGANQGGLCPAGTWCETRNYTPSVLYDANYFGDPLPCTTEYKMWRTGADASGRKSLGFAVTNLTGNYYEPVSDVGNTLEAERGSPATDVVFTWTVVPDADHYHVYRGTDPDFAANPPTLVKESYTDEDTGKAGWQCKVTGNFNNLYFFKVFAANACEGESQN